jgi:hypothetical protein
LGKRYLEVKDSRLAFFGGENCVGGGGDEPDIFLLSAGVLIVEPNNALLWRRAWEGRQDADGWMTESDSEMMRIRINETAIAMEILMRTNRCQYKNDTVLARYAR